MQPPDEVRASPNKHPPCIFLVTSHSENTVESRYILTTTILPIIFQTRAVDLPQDPVPSSASRASQPISRQTLTQPQHSCIFMSTAPRGAGCYRDGAANLEVGGSVQWPWGWGMNYTMDGRNGRQSQEVSSLCLTRGIIPHGTSLPDKPSWSTPSSPLEKIASWGSARGQQRRQSFPADVMKYILHETKF